MCESYEYSIFEGILSENSYTITLRMAVPSISGIAAVHASCDSHIKHSFCSILLGPLP